MTVQPKGVAAAPCAIIGLGVVFCRGRGVEALARAAQEGWRAPASVTAPFEPSGSGPAFPIDLAACGDKGLLSRLRRADRFSQLAALAARDALADAQLPDFSPDRIGIILATGLGPHVTTFRFLDEILTYGDQGPSALVFSHSVHNTAASYVATLLGLHGPSVTIAQADFAFHQALLLAESWLVEGRCDRVLVGAVDELGEVMRYACREKCSPPADGRLRPFSFQAQPRTVPGEGSFFFVLERESNAGGVRVSAATGVERPPEEADLLLVDADGLSGNEALYRARLPRRMACASYVALAGGMLIGSAFHAAIATWMLRHGTILSAPDVWGVPLDGPLRPRRISCFKLNCAGEGGLLRLSATSIRPAPVP